MMESSEWDRRTYLRQTAALSATVSSISVAGCSAVLPWGDDVEYGTVDSPAPVSENQPYLDWIPTLSALGLEGHGRYSNGQVPRRYVEPAKLTATEAPLNFSSYLTQFSVWQEYLGVAFEEYDRLLSISGSWDTIIEADFDRNVVFDLLLENGYSHQTTRHGFDILDRHDLHRTVAVGDDLAVFVREERNSEYPDHDKFLPAIVDAITGNGKRYRDEGSYAEVLERIDPYPYNRYYLWEGDWHRADNQTFRSLTFDAETIYLIYTIGGETSPPTEAEIQESLEGDGWRSWDSTARDARRVDIETGERFTTVTMAVDPEQFTGRVGDHEFAPPVSWGFDHQEADGTLTITHEGGEAIPTRYLSVLPDRLDELPSAVTGDIAVFEQGDQLTVEFGENEPGFVAMEYEPGEDHSYRFFEFDI